MTNQELTKWLKNKFNSCYQITNNGNIETNITNTVTVDNNDGNTPTLITLVDGNALSPYNTNLIRKVYYNGYRIRMGNIPAEDALASGEIYNDDYNVSFNNGIIETNITGASELINVWYEVSSDETSTTTDTLTVHWRRLKTIRDIQRGIDFPSIMDCDQLKIALHYYIITNIIRHGHTIGNFDITSNIPTVNPELLMQKHLAMAKHDVSFDKRTYDELAIQNSTLLLDATTYKS
jgi:hypothetical protein